MEVLKAGMEVDPENETFGALLEETKREYEEDNSLAIDHPER